MKDTLLVSLPLPVTLPDGSEATDAVIRNLTFRERYDISKKHSNNGMMFAFEQVQKRLVRLGDLASPIDKTVVENMPALVFDELQEATLALDLGFDTLEAFRGSEKYEGLRG